MNSLLWALPGPVSVNLFFAILPPDGVRTVIAGLGGHLQRTHRLQGRLITSDCLHNTLASVHDEHGALQDSIARARSIAARIRYAPFPVRFDQTQSFRQRSGRHPFVLSGGEGLAPLMAFRQMLASQMRADGFEVSRSYTPHLTLLWADRCVGDYPVYPICWTAEDFVLVLSRVGQSQHTHLGRWPLQYSS